MKQSILMLEEVFHTLAVKATNRFEATRDKVQKYLNAKHREEIIFTKGATEAINLVASSYGKKYIKKEMKY